MDIRCPTWVAFECWSDRREESFEAASLSRQESIRAEVSATMLLMR